ncbi:hypothetical protein QBC44DRAFT_302746 [Cladorrhinum sp. PSN332]|nr:hypothetical protein QBC44DRAFT_302746 [Cladorrhinum sp. PSN332]
MVGLGGPLVYRSPGALSWKHCVGCGPFGSCDNGSYATRDLFVNHPIVPDAYRYFFRLDEIMAPGNHVERNHKDTTIRQAIYLGNGRSEANGGSTLSGQEPETFVNPAGSADLGV